MFLLREGEGMMFLLVKGGGGLHYEKARRVKRKTDFFLGMVRFNVII